jgi:Na+/H+-dicarboxylate symporter
VNLIGNGVATVVISKSEKAFDAEKNRRALEGYVVLEEDRPLDEREVVSSAAI